VLTLAQAFPGSNLDRIRRALEIQLRSRAIDVAATSQRFTPRGDVTDLMAEARASAANLEAASTRLSRLAVLLDSLRAGAEGRKLLAAGTRQAEQVLATTQEVFDRQRFFSPSASGVAAWQGVTPLSYAALGVTDSLSLETRSLQHITGVRALAHDVAPALRFLRSPALESTPMQRLVDDWEAIALSVSKWERGDPTASLGALHRYVREDMLIREMETCRAMVRRDTGTAQADVFVIRRRQFKAALGGRCGNAGMEAAARYERLRTLFTRHLAGRYPFVERVASGRARPPAADPAGIRAFFRAYDDFMIVSDIALRSDPRLAGPAGAAMIFLDQVAAARAFLAPMLEPGDRTLPRYSMLVTPIDTVADVELYVADRVLPLDEGQREERWQFGDTVRVVRSDLSGSETVFTAGGGWSLLQLLQSGGEHVKVRVFHPDTKTEVQLPGFPAGAPEIVLPRPPRARR
jgi:hypothetical protein